MEWRLCCATKRPRFRGSLRARSAPAISCAFACKCQQPRGKRPGKAQAGAWRGEEGAGRSQGVDGGGTENRGGRGQRDAQGETAEKAPPRHHPKAAGDGTSGMPRVSASVRTWTIWPSVAVCASSLSRVMMAPEIFSSPYSSTTLRVSSEICRADPRSKQSEATDRGAGIKGRQEGAGCRVSCWQEVGLEA
jgi:hypothetical protein